MLQVVFDDISTHTQNLSTTYIHILMFVPSHQWKRIFHNTAKFRRFVATAQAATKMHADLNNTQAARPAIELAVDPTYAGRSFSISSIEDDSLVRQTYRPFLLDDAVTKSDWIAQLELNTVLKMVDTEIFQKGDDRLRVLVLYGSMRSRWAFPFKL